MRERFQLIHIVYLLALHACLLFMGSLSAEECQTALVAKPTLASIEKELTDIRKNVKLPILKIGFNANSETLELDRAQAGYLMKLKRLHGLSDEQIASKLQDAFANFHTRQPWELIYLMELSFQVQAESGDLAAVFNLMREEIQYCKSNGFHGPNEKLCLTLNFEQLMHVFQLMEADTTRIPAVAQDFGQMAEHFGASFTDEVLTLLSLKIGLKMETAAVIQLIDDIRSLFVVEKRRMGFQASADLQRPTLLEAGALLGLISQYGLKLDQLLENFENYKIMTDNPVFGDFLSIVAQKVEEAVRQKQQAQQQQRRPLARGARALLGGAR
jgi:hypothetical protein